jgi:predicted metalloprotease with PDZ domain
MPEAISYLLRFPRPEWHGIEVEASFPTEGCAGLDLMMAVWTPGSYLLREFARHIEEIAAHGDDADRRLALTKLTKNRWRVSCAGQRRVTVRYRLYARELSVRTNFVDAGFCLINGAATFLTLADDGPRPHEVRLVLPPAWTVAVSALPAAPGGDAAAFRAADFAHLVDSPIYAGSAPVYRFEVEGRPHLLVNEGEEGPPWDGPRSARDVERVVREQLAFWGALPYERYVFFNLIAEGAGGLEHGDSSVLMTSRWRARSHEGWLEWLGLVSHELFHAWNVKRLRPADLDDLDYEREVYTRSLWQVEGVTSYYDDLLVHRAGLSSRGDYLRQLSKQIETLETTPGRHVQALADASFDTWIKFYRRDENFLNSAISYYTKGAVASFLLDARIRAATGGERSLDDVLRLAYRQFSGPRGYRRAELEAAASTVAGLDLAPWFASILDSTADLDYQEVLEWFGLRFGEAEAGESTPAGGGRSCDCRHPSLAAPDGPESARKRPENHAWLGVVVETQGGRIQVAEVRRGTPAHEAGVNVGDEILAIGEYRVPPDGLRERLKHYRPGETEALLVARRDRLLRLAVTFGAVPRPHFRLQPAPDATADQRRHLDDWLGPALA